MRIVYVSDERYPSTHTDTQQVMMTLDALAGAGADVHFVIPAFLKGPHASSQVEDARTYYGTRNAFPIHPIDLFERPLHLSRSRFFNPGVTLFSFTNTTTATTTHLLLLHTHSFPPATTTLPFLGLLVA